MLLAAFEDEKGKILIIGLSAKALKQMLDDKKAMVATLEHHRESLKPLGISKLIIVKGEETDMLAYMQALAPDAPSRIHPDLFS